MTQTPLTRALAGVFTTVLLGAAAPALAVGNGPDIVCPRAMAVEASGTILVTGGCSTLAPVTVLRIDPVTGDRTILTGGLVGTGPALDVPMGIAVDGDGHVLVLDAFSRSVIRVDPLTGDRTILIDDDPSRGARLLTPISIAVAPSGDVLVGDGGQIATRPPLPPVDVFRALIRVPHDFLHRETASGGGFFGSKVGEGPTLLYPDGLAVMPDGTIVIVSGRGSTKRGVMQVDPVTGNRKLLAAPRKGSGPVLRNPFAIAVEAAGTLVILERGIFRLDPATLVRTVVADDTRGSGPFVGGWAIAVEADGSLLALTSTAVLRVDPVTGDRTVLSGTAP